MNDQNQEAKVTRAGALDMQVCVPQVWTDERVKEFADLENLCGTSGGWVIRKEGNKWLNGEPERAECSDRPGYVHVTLDA